MVRLYILQPVTVSHPAAAEIILASVKAGRCPRLTVGGVIEISLFGTASLKIVVAVAVVAAKVSSVIVSRSIWHFLTSQYVRLPCEV
jgi:hypothetical protein